MRFAFILFVVLSTVVLASAVGRVVVRRGERVRHRDLAGCSKSVSGFSAASLEYAMGRCYNPNVAPADGKAGSPGALVSSPDCHGDEKCCIFVQCQWTVPDDDAMHDKYQSMSGNCLPAAQCSSLPERRTVTDSSTCSGAGMACCIATDSGTVGEGMDADAARIKDLKSTPCNDNSGTCDPECGTGTFAPDNGSACKGGECCVTSSSSADSSSHDDADTSSHDADTSSHDADASTDSSPHADGDSSD